MQDERPDSMKPDSMKKIGKYEVVEKIGVGGFGEVFKAKDPFIERWVAVKTCTSEDEETRQRFSREAKIAGKLSHRNVTTVYDFGLESSFPFLVQEYLSGEDLDRKIKRRDYLPYAEKLHCLIQIARGLAYAHQQGVIHRDIKPANIRVLEDGTVKIMDFGIAKLAQQETSLTRTGMTVGTAAYLAPEQIRGEKVGLHTDVFSFGVLAYELFTYERPFLGEQISAVIYQILHREPRPIRETWPTAPTEVVELIARCLAKDVSERFADAPAVLRFLEHMQEVRRSPAREATDLEGTGSGSEGTVTPAPPAAPAAPPVPVSPSPATPPSGVRQAGLRQAGPRQAGLRQAQPQAQPPASEPELMLDTAATRQQTIDDLELTSVRLDESTRSQAVPLRGAVPIQGAAQARPSPARYVVLVLLAVLALTVGWALGDRGRREQVVGFLSALAGREPPVTEDEIVDDEVPPPVDLADTSDQAQTPDPPPPSGTETAPPGGEAATDPGQQVPPPPPPPPPPPEPGRLVVSEVAWTSAMTVRVGRNGRRYPLTRERGFPLPPGAYDVIFELAEPDYQTRETVRVNIRENERTRLETPILRPGALSIRAGLNQPQGRVHLDGEELGSTPIRHRTTAPGTYRIRILPRFGDGEGIDSEVVVQPGQETVLTFDLETGTVNATVKPLAVPGPAG